MSAKPAKPFRVSWSGLRRWEECRQKHLLTITRKTAAIEDGRNFLQGTVTDRIMRAWLEASGEGPSMASMVDEYFQRYAFDDPEYVIKWRGPNDPFIAKNTVRDAVRQLEPLLREHVLPHEYQPELSFNVPIDVPAPWGEGKFVTVELVGGIDVVVRRGAGKRRAFDLWDLKVTANDDYYRKVLGQLKFYGLVMETLTGQPPERVGLLQPLAKDKAPTYHFTDADRLEMVQRVTRMVHGMIAKEWDPKVQPDDECKWCSARGACPLFSTPIEEVRGSFTASFEAAADARRAARDSAKAARDRLSAAQPA